MARMRVTVLLVAAALALVGASAASALRLTSPAFRSGGAIPKRFSCDGADVSPPLHWTAPPARTRTIALQVVDVSTPSRFVHWLAWGISPRSRGLTAGARPPRQGRNDFGRVGWGGPCPPAGTTHRYVFMLYALARPLRLQTGASAREFQQAVGRAGMVRQALLIGTYRRHA
jgi:Raf kinase inhibitor-like YbhB/YbcL family protein